MAIVAIQKAGLGITQTTWSALSIFVSFFWGAFVFHEHVKNLGLAFAGMVSHHSLRYLPRPKESL
jgi:multidrug transporter EmrE-like cation transporter